MENHSRPDETISEINGGAPRAETAPATEVHNDPIQLVEAQRLKLDELTGQKKALEAELDSLRQLEVRHRRMVRLYNDLENYIKHQSATNESISELPHARVKQPAPGRWRNGALKNHGLYRPVFFECNALSGTDSGDMQLADKEAESDKFISFKHRFVYFAVPKVASQSVILALKNYCRDGEYLHSKEPLPKLLLDSPEIAQFFKFSVVRHPFNRLVSCYIDKILDATPDTERMLRKAGMVHLPASFAEFVEWVFSCPDRDANNHWASQTGILASSDGTLLVDAVVHLENLESELAEVFKHRGLEPLVFNRVKNTRKAHLERCGVEAQRFDNAYFWTGDIEAKLLMRYANDYRNFGYLPLSAAGARVIPTLSVVICTHNRQKHLKACIQLVAEQIPIIGLARIEVVVVDNASSDDTGSMLGELAGKYRWLRFAREDNLGLSHARNCGANLAQGDYLCYLDDDARTGPEYLKNVFRVIDEHHPDIFGGPVFPFYTSPKPFWFQDALEIRQHAHESGFCDCPISGGNFIIRADLLKQLGMFSTDYGMLGTKLRLGDERELLERYRNVTPTTERRIYYSLECFIYHHVPAWKMTLRYLMRRAYESGKMRAMLSEAFPSDGVNKGDNSIQQPPVSLLRLVLFGRKGIYFPVRVLHRLALLSGIMVQRATRPHANKGNAGRR